VNSNELPVQIQLSPQGITSFFRNVLERNARDTLLHVRSHTAKHGASLDWSERTREHLQARRIGLSNGQPTRNVKTWNRKRGGQSRISTMGIAQRWRCSERRRSCIGRTKRSYRTSRIARDRGACEKGPGVKVGFVFLRMRFTRTLSLAIRSPNLLRKGGLAAQEQWVIASILVGAS
jgi:hypothetical protein